MWKKGLGQRLNELGDGARRLIEKEDSEAIAVILGWMDEKHPGWQSDQIKAVRWIRVTMWQRAAKTGNLNILKQLQHHELEPGEAFRGASGLMGAVQGGQQHALDWLLQQGARPDIGDEMELDEDGSLLHHAVDSNRVDIVKTLTRAGACLNMVNGRGLTPLAKTAVAMTSKPMFTALLMLGADPDIGSFSGGYTTRTWLQRLVDRKPSEASLAWGAWGLAEIERCRLEQSTGEAESKGGFGGQRL